MYSLCPMALTMLVFSASRKEKMSAVVSCHVLTVKHPGTFHLWQNASHLIWNVFFCLNTLVYAALSCIQKRICEAYKEHKILS